MSLTWREIEILEILKQEPLISQVELAERVGLTRSSVAVHISNLMRKGVILGKGYVFNPEAAIVIFGESCICIDVDEQSDNKIDVNISGFAYNAAKAFAELGVKTKIVTIVGQDQLGEYMIDKMQEKKIDVSNIYRHPTGSNKSVSINNSITYQQKFTLESYEKVVDKWEWIFFNSDWLLIDPILQQSMVNKILYRNDEKLPLAATCKYIDDFDQITPAYYNSSLLVIGMENSEKFEKYIKFSWNSDKIKIPDCIITDGRTRLIYINNDTTIDFPLLPNQSFCPKTRLPFLLAGMVYGLTRHYQARQVVRIAVGIASANDIP